MKGLRQVAILGIESATWYAMCPVAQLISLKSSKVLIFVFYFFRLDSCMGYLGKKTLLPHSSAILMVPNIYSVFAVAK